MVLSPFFWLQKQYSNSATSIRKSKLLLPNPNTVSIDFPELQIDFVRHYISIANSNFIVSYLWLSF